MSPKLNPPGESKKQPGQLLSVKQKVTSAIQFSSLSADWVQKVRLNS